MKVDITQRRQVEHPLWDDAPISDHDDGIWADGSELCPEFFVGLDALGLSNRQIQFQGRVLDRRRDKFQAASLGPVRLSDNKTYAEAGSNKFLERGNSEERSSAENEI